MNGPALAVVMRKILADDILFGNALMSSGPGDCGACRLFSRMRNASYLSLQKPSVNYSKTVAAEHDNDFVVQASSLFDAVSSAAVD